MRSMGAGVALVMASALALWAGEGEAECIRPGPRPVIPNGGIASADEMKRAHDAVQVFVDQLTKYQLCLEQQIETDETVAKPETRAGWRREANSAVDEAHTVGDTFSLQLRAYNANHPPK